MKPYFSKVNFLLIALSFSIGDCILLGQPLTLAERLGYDKDARLLIVHADDAAVSHSTNQAIFDAIEKGHISSTAIMVPCPWFPEIASFAVENPEYDYGLHLTFTSEWYTYKWGGISSADQISGLLDDQGYFYSTTEEAVQHADPAEVDREMRAQIEKALAAGIIPSHFDSHMLPHFGSLELFEIYLKLGEDYHIPVLLPKNYLEERDSFNIPQLNNHVIIDELIETPTDIKPEDWNQYYTGILQNLQPGVYELIFHLAYDNEETRAMTRYHEYYEATWRQRDVDYCMSEEFQEVLKANNIQLITWRQIQKIMYP